jgi:PAS domain S-box-containing protein
MVAQANQAPMDEFDILRATFKSLSAGIIVCDPQGTFVFSNPEAERILGMLPEAVSPSEWTPGYGCYCADMVTPYPPERLPLARAMRGEEVLHELIFIQNPRQSAGVWISASARPFTDRAGTIRGAVVVFHDITDAQDVLLNRVSSAGTGEKPAVASVFEASLVLERFARFREVHDQLCRALEQTADTVVITDSEGVIEYVNRAFEKTTGYAPSEALGQTPRILKSGAHDAQFYKGLWDKLLAGEPFRGTLVNRKKSGELYWAEQTITPMRDGNQKITHFISVLRDVTELREKQRQEFHLQLAKEIQQRLYNTAVSVPGFDMAGVAYPADQTGGDYFDFIPQPGGGLFIVIGDVTGHGFGAALVMAETRACLRSCVNFVSDIGSLLGYVNRSLAADLAGGQHVTLLLARLDPRSRELQYASAGHVPGYLLRRSGEIGLVLESTGPPLGLFSNCEYSSSQVIPLACGDTLLLLTDGVTEMENPDLDQFGTERALEFVRGHLEDSARAIVQGLYEAARAFAAGHPQHDDITSVVCKVSSPGAPAL